MSFPLICFDLVIQSSFISLAEGVAIADGLNPLTISHTANTISCTPMGRYRISKVLEVNFFAIVDDVIEWHTGKSLLRDIDGSAQIIFALGEFDVD